MKPNLFPFLVFAFLRELAPARTSPTTKSSSSPLRCRAETLAVYKVTFQTFWDRETFPRQYPEWRPPAQWSKLIGFSHNPSYRLFEVGKTATAAVKQFAETGETDELDLHPRGGRRGDNTGEEEDDEEEEDDDQEEEEGGGPLFDGFSAPPVTQGAGTTHAKIFVDGNHTLISVMSKLVPSPDWFVGLDSLDLCENGRFVDLLTVESNPLDAGTDNGFTFTSPNWPTTPAGLIYRITHEYPSHPAGSFYYPELPALPTIAAFNFRKEREYDLTEEFRFDGDQVRHVSKFGSSKDRDKGDMYNYYDVEKGGGGGQDSDSIVDFVPAPYDDEEEKEEKKAEKEGNQYKEEGEEQEEEEEVEEEEITSNEIPDLSSSSSHQVSHHSRHHSSSSLPRRHHGHHGNALRQAHIKSFRGRSGYHASTGPADFFKKKYRSEILEEAQEKLYGNQKSLYERIMEKYSGRRRGLTESLAKKLKRRKMRRLRKKKTKSKHRPPRDCKTSNWSEWSPCSKTCGFGEAKRVREVVKQPKRGGKACPPLQDVKWCGSARNCHGRYFDW